MFDLWSGIYTLVEDKVQASIFRESRNSNRKLGRLRAGYPRKKTVLSLAGQLLLSTAPWMQGLKIVNKELRYLRGKRFVQGGKCCRQVLVC